MLNRVVKLALCVQVPDVDQSCAVEPQQVILVHHENVKWNFFGIKKLSHVWHKSQNIFKTCTNWNDNRKLFLLVTLVIVVQNQISYVKVFPFRFECLRSIDLNEM
jgi:hypothetical protein